MNITDTDTDTQIWRTARARLLTRCDETLLNQFEQAVINRAVRNITTLPTAPAVPVAALRALIETMRVHDDAGDIGDDTHYWRAQLAALCDAAEPT